MDIDAKKLEILQLVLNTEEHAKLDKVKAVLVEKAGDWWDQLNEEEQLEIHEGLQQVEEGKTTHHKKVMAKFDKWK